MKLYRDLFVSWFKMGLFTFGGGYAMLPMIQKEVIEKHQWASEEEVMDYYAIGQCTPGIIAVNTATFIGFKLRGVSGAIVATLGVITPSLIIITIIASTLSNFQELVIVQKALSGIRIGVCVLMSNAIYKLAKSSIKDRYNMITFIIALCLSLFTNLSIIILVVIFGLSGIGIKTFLAAKEVKG